MIKKKYDINSLDKLSSVALELLSLSDNRIFALYGEMGVGKTTLVKYMCYHLKVFDSISSPTFSIVNEYVNSDRNRLFHFDFYRLNKIEEIQALGVDTYFNSGNYCFIEWPELIESLLPNKHQIIEIKHLTDKRQLFLLE